MDSGSESRTFSPTRSRPGHASFAYTQHDRNAQQSSGHASDQPEGQNPRHGSSEDARITSPHQGPIPIIARDYAQRSMAMSPTRQRNRNTDVHFGPPSIRRRAGSTQTSANPSPGPGFAHSLRLPYESSRRSVAIAPSGPGTDIGSRKFSLAGPPQIDALVANQPYVDPGYAQLNPAYDQPTNVRPVWGLAKPLPHVLRPGMVPSKDELDKELREEIQQQEETGESADLESGRVEPSLRPDKITNQLDVIRRERELSLFRTYRNQYADSPFFSPFGDGRRDSGTPTPTQSDHHDSRGRSGDTIEEESEEHEHSHHTRLEEIPELELPQLREAIENVNQAKEEEELLHPYQDAIPLPAYDNEDDEIHNLHTYWSVIRLRFREPLAELLGITVQFTIGFSASLSLTVSRGASGVGDTADWAWGLATMIAIYIAGGISGAHLNPAMSIMLSIYRGFPVSKIPIYVAAQFLGAFLATLISFGIFQPGLIVLQQEEPYLTTQNQHGPISSTSLSDLQLLSNFITFPRNAWVDTSTAFLTELTGTTILAISVLALGDDANAPPGAGMNAFIIGLLINVLSMAFGYNTGLAMNPVRDFGPRVAMAAVGYNKDNALFADGYWFRVAWLGPIAGAILGGFLYDSAIFVGGESPVNYPTERIRRSGRKWKKRWRAKFKRTKRAIKDVKDGIARPGYEPLNS